MRYLFPDPTNDDYTLTDSSPCIDAGDPASPPDPDVQMMYLEIHYYSSHNVLNYQV